MKKGLLIKLMISISKMSKKASAIYLSVLSALFFAFLILLIYGLILIDPGKGNPTPLALILTISGGVGLILSVLGVALTTIASNYVKKNQNRDSKNKNNKS